jgi:hypothetical protein
VASLVSVAVPAGLKMLDSPSVRQTDDRSTVGRFPVVQTESFELVDQNGVVRAWLGPLEDGAVVLAMRDQTETIRVVLIADAAETTVAVSSNEGGVVWRAP